MIAKNTLKADNQNMRRQFNDKHEKFSGII